MVLFVYVLIFLYGNLVLAPLPPIRPTLPRPLLLSTLDQSTEANADSLASKPTRQQVIFIQEQPNQSQTLQQLYARVAARSLGEGSFALPEIACTIKNRLRVSRASLSTVLRAYHASDVSPKPAQIEIVRRVFEGELVCPATWWYALSLQDTKHWRPHQRPPVKVVQSSARKQILIFER